MYNNSYLFNLIFFYKNIKLKKLLKTSLKKNYSIFYYFKYYCKLNYIKHFRYKIKQYI